MTTTANLRVGGEAFAQFGRRYAQRETEVYRGRVLAISGSGVARIDFGEPRGIVSFVRRGVERASGDLFGGYLIDADTFARLRPIMQRERGMRRIHQHAFAAARGEDLPAIVVALETALAIAKRLQGEQSA